MKIKFPVFCLMLVLCLPILLSLQSCCSAPEPVEFDVLGIELTPKVQSQPQAFVGSSGFIFVPAAIEAVDYAPNQTVAMDNLIFSLSAITENIAANKTHRMAINNAHIEDATVCRTGMGHVGRPQCFFLH